MYSQAERATKYGLLFVALTFAVFFVFEILKQLPIHPIQYLLVGLVLVLFFLLLYGALYGLLNSENNALVMGSILLFAVLAALMVATRKVDWYQIGKPAAAAN